MVLRSEAKSRLEEKQLPVKGRKSGGRCREMNQLWLKPKKQEELARKVGSAEVRLDRAPEDHKSSGSHAKC